MFNIDDTVTCIITFIHNLNKFYTWRGNVDTFRMFTKHSYVACITYSMRLVYLT